MSKIDDHSRQNPAYRPASIVKKGVFLDSIKGTIKKIIDKEKDDRTPGKVLYRAKMKYGNYVIKNGTYRGVEARLYEVDDVRESASYMGDRKYEPVFDYIKCFCRVLDENPETRNILMIGGAGFQFPKYAISRHPDVSMEVVEIEPLAVKIARDYFYLDDLEEEFGAESSGRLKIVIDDGMNFLGETDGKYDIIINDAYHSDKPDSALSSPKGIMRIQRHMAVGGIYLFNLITSIEGTYSMPLNMSFSLLNSLFADVKCLRCTPDIPDERLQNVVFCCKNEADQKG